MRKLRYGWIPDLPDHRDLVYAAPKLAAPLPTIVDLRNQMPPVYDQGDLGSCTANAIAAASEFLWMQKAHEIVPSRLFIYYNEREIEGDVNQDNGAQLRDGIKAVVQWGECPETQWPYDPAKFAVKPTQDCYDHALQHQVLTYRRVSNNLLDMQSALAGGYPFVFGFSVYESFESEQVAATGIMTIPKRHEQSRGGHAVMAVGYDKNKKWFIVRNSWGDVWGDKGYFYMPFAYLSNNNLADDRWVITNIEQDA
jgi:C1A family cysteine protease